MNMISCKAAARFGFLATFLSVLPSCSPPEIGIAACMAGSKLAFMVGDKKGWFSTLVKPRPYIIEVYGISHGPAWATQVPYEARKKPGLHTQPFRNLIVYGQVFDGWEIKTPALPLVKGQKYSITIWSSGGVGIMYLTAGAKLPECNSVRLQVY